MRFLALFAALLCLCGCNSETTSDLDAIETRPITMPNGKDIRAEVMINGNDLQRGMMFRESLAEGRGMLFMHKQPQPYSYWMYQVKIPLDMIFMDSQRKVLGVAANTPPCTTKASECPQYGNFPDTKYVLELGGGEAKKYGVQPGVTIGF